MTRAEVSDNSHKHFVIMEGEGGPRIYSFARCRHCSSSTSRHTHPTDLVRLIEDAEDHTRRHHPELLADDQDAGGEG